MTSPLRSFWRPSFLICTGILAVASASKEYTLRQMGVYFSKSPIPLKASFEKLNETKIAPYLVQKKNRITNRDVLDSLGTEEYLQWELEDPEVPKDSPLRFCSLFITYYTGNPDMVPHVPDECYVGGGNTKLASEVLAIPIQKEFMPESVRSLIPDTLGVQSILFSQRLQGPMPIEKELRVQYFFKVNGKYASSRTETRTLLGSNFFSRYSYFCKVEWKFYGFGFAEILYPDKNQVIEGSRKLLSILLPVLETDHWPDWEEINQKPNDS
ncbi:MAG TPA: hypothetical protein PKY88_02355 [Anaerohalosphaeraceae bacterium]|nr:hypothetical protein [Anaerohalosphaeraceae bacterium]